MSFFLSYIHDTCLSLGNFYYSHYLKNLSDIIMYDSAMRPETPDAVGDIIDRVHQTTSNIAQQRRAKMLSLSPAGNTSGAGTPTKDDVIRDLRAQIYALNMDMDTLKMDLADANERAAPSQRSREDVRRRD